MNKKVLLLCLCALLVSCSSQQQNKELRTVLETNNITPLELNLPDDPHKVALGNALFFDKVVSGNQDISCATCHHPTLAGADGLSLSIGTGGAGLGTERERDEKRPFVPRHAPDLFNRGVDEWRVLFWDGRVAHDPYDEITVQPENPFENPANHQLPVGLDNVLAVQAMFPPTSRAEMQGLASDKNEISSIPNGDPNDIWDGLMERILSHDEYQTLFSQAYPDTELEDMNFVNAANALAAFEIDAFSFDDSPWDLYVAGDDDALSDEQIEGAFLFYGDAGCAQCHSGNLFTDQSFHNIAVPQIGPGKSHAEGLDIGRALETGKNEDMFAFRTPPLANVEFTAPYMHNGAYLSLEDAVRHHYNPRKSLITYDWSQLHEELQDMVHNDKKYVDQIWETVDPLVEEERELSDEELDYLMAFLSALSSPQAQDLTGLIPESVPSGLSIQD